ncbi:hypothetical protein ACLGIH_15020 [Streptomyces sp. HMX87]|uniref:hypothetical protein n=1 Tax=Streptomyces sp. HMX87 TaxID=3390849 RepID=UPI003A840D54
MGGLRGLRVLAVAAGAAGALALTGCSDGSSDSGAGSGSGSGSGDKASATPGATASADTGGGTGGGTGGSSSAPSGELEGSWFATTDGKAVALVVNGTEAGLFATGGTVCSGSAGKDAGARMIRLTCTDGNDDRATGTVESVDGKTLKVEWAGSLGVETYTKAEGSSLPPRLPTSGLGS